MTGTLEDDRTVVRLDGDVPRADGPADHPGTAHDRGRVRAEPGATAGGRRRDRRLTIAAVAVVATVATWLAISAPTAEPTENVMTGLGPVDDRRGGRTVGPASTALRWSPVTATTGTHHLVWGGEDGSGEVDRADGFSVDLASGAVEPIPNAPITRLSETDGAWTGEELVVVSSGACTSCATPAPSAAAWDPQGGWHGVADPPASLGEGTVGAVWTGSTVVVLTRSGVAAAYDPTSDRWDDLPNVPAATAATQSSSLVWTGSEVVAWSASAYAGPFPTEVGSAIADRGWALADGAEAWRPLPDLPPGSRTQLGTLMWTGRELVVWGAAAGGTTGEEVGVGASLRPGDRGWTPLPASPQSPGDGFEGTAGSQSVAVDPATGDVVVLPLDLTGGTGTRDLAVFHPDARSWTSTDVALGGYAPTITVVDGMLLVPHPGSPVAARLP